MKASLVCLSGCFVLITGLAAVAKKTALQYQFTAAQTNVYSVKISVQGENGTDLTTGNVIVVTEDVNSNHAKISFHTDLQQQIRRDLFGGPRLGQDMYPWMGNNYAPDSSEIVLNNRGQEMWDGGDPVLAAPLGKMIQCIFEPLPAKGDDTETVTRVAILDAPQWLGPAENFQNPRMMGAPVYYSEPGQRTGPGLLYLTRRCTIKFHKSGERTGNLVSWHKHSEFESWLKTGNVPEFSATTESDFTFDRNAGLLTQIDTAGGVVSQTDTSSRRAEVSFKARRLVGDELAAALIPPEPVQPKVLSGADLDKVLADLKSDDPDRRRGAVRQLNGVPVENPPLEMVVEVAAMAWDGDTPDGDRSVQMGAASFLADHATTNEVPVLLKLLKNPDWSVRQNDMKALGRLKDPRSIQPLTDLLAANPNLGQTDLDNALVRFGPAAEPKVLTLFTEKNAETRRQACVILQQIGTTNSLPVLQNQTGDPDQSLSQAAADAIRQIKMRQ